MIVSYFMWSKIFIFAMLTVPKMPWAKKIHENFEESFLWNFLRIKYGARYVITSLWICPKHNSLKFP